MKKKTHNDNPSVTTYMIAAKAGVHQSTVSRVLSGNSQIPEKTVRKVLKVCKELNYVPNMMAKCFKDSKSYMIAVHIPFDAKTVFSDPFVTEFLHGIRSEADKHDYSVMLSYINPEDTELEFANIVKSRRADGLIIASVKENDPRLKILEKDRIPAVVGLCSNKLCPTIASVDIDNTHSGFQAVRFGLMSGKNHFAVLIGKERNCVDQNFENGVRAAASQAGMSSDNLVIYYVDDSALDGIEVAKRILSDDNTQVVIVQNTMPTFGVAKILSQSPNDIMLIGMGSPLLDQLYPGFCKMVQPAEELGQENAKSLIQILQTGKSPSPKLLYSHIIDANGWFFQERPPAKK